MEKLERGKGIERQKTSGILKFETSKKEEKENIIEIHLTLRLDPKSIPITIKLEISSLVDIETIKKATKIALEKKPEPTKIKFPEILTKFGQSLSEFEKILEEASESKNLKYEAKIKIGNLIEKIKGSPQQLKIEPEEEIKPMLEILSRISSFYELFFDEILNNIEKGDKQSRKVFINHITEFINQLYLQEGEEFKKREEFEKRLISMLNGWKEGRSQLGSLIQFLSNMTSLEGRIDGLNYGTYIYPIIAAIADTIDRRVLRLGEKERRILVKTVKSLISELRNPSSPAAIGNRARIRKERKIREKQDTTGQEENKNNEPQQETN